MCAIILLLVECSPQKNVSFLSGNTVQRRIRCTEKWPPSSTQQAEADGSGAAGSSI